MDQVASKIVARMMMANLISEKDAEEYSYGVQILLEKIISYATILLLALILNRLLEIILFVVSFSRIRKYSGAGSYTSGLYFKVDSNFICEINTPHRKSNYQAFGSKTHYYTLKNTSGKHVSVTFSKLQY